MLKSHEKFHSANGRRLILIVDDERINREMLGAVLSTDYELIFAENGREALEKIRANKDQLSLVLLDLLMPVMSGTEVLREIQADPELQKIPVIVLTSDQNAEIRSLEFGAIDFIPKPYPQPGVILARARRTIELSEDRDIIQSTERDPLTGLYNREYFYRYAEQFDQHHRGDADGRRRRGRQPLPHDQRALRHGLRRQGAAAHRREAAGDGGDTGGIVCRREADTFMVYCPHGKDYTEDSGQTPPIGLPEDERVNSRVRLRIGVYADVDKSIDIERRFDRAKMAADTVRNSFARAIGQYDATLHERELYAEQLIEPRELLLEITESAYTQDSDQIIETVNALRELGFRIEMDDFGTGYSSLNMISTLPIDALKLDMQFIRNAFGAPRTPGCWR